MWISFYSRSKEFFKCLSRCFVVSTSKEQRKVTILYDGEWSRFPGECGFIKRMWPPSVRQKGKLSYIEGNQKPCLWLPKLQSSPHRNGSRKQQICWHLGHAFCLEVLCHICCRLMPGGTWVLSRWLCWENIFYIWFLESIKPSGKLSILQSREVREEREDESKSASFAVGTARGSGNIFYFNCVFQALGSFWLFLL